VYMPGMRNQEAVAPPTPASRPRMRMSSQRPRRACQSVSTLGGADRAAGTGRTSVLPGRGAPPDSTRAVSGLGSLGCVMG
jgi:hypothetical protein